MEVEVVFQPNALTRGYEHVVKDLGKWARRNLGMRGRTDPGEFTQIIWKGEVLGLNQPLALFMDEGQEERHCLTKMLNNRNKRCPGISDL